MEISGVIRKGESWLVNWKFSSTFKFEDAKIKHENWSVGKFENSFFAYFRQLYVFTTYIIWQKIILTFAFADFLVYLKKRFPCVSCVDLCLSIEVLSRNFEREIFQNSHIWRDKISIEDYKVISRHNKTSRWTEFGPLNWFLLWGSNVFEDIRTRETMVKNYDYSDGKN